MSAANYTDADLTYLAAGFLTLDALCAGRSETAGAVRTLIARRRLPAPSYVLADGTGLFPPDYFRLLDEAGGVDRLQAHFAARHRAACATEGGFADELDADWQAYLDGTFGICLRAVSPETIVRKGRLVARLSELVLLAAPGDDGWRRDLHHHVEALDALEREFAPDYDRAPDRGRRPTRDLLIAAARERHPEVFAD